MTLRIAKPKELLQHRRIQAEKPVSDVLNGMEPSDPEPEVLGIPGLVREMIGRFSSNDCAVNGYHHAKQSSVQQKPFSAAPTSSASLFIGDHPQNLPQTVDCINRDIVYNGKNETARSEVSQNSRPHQRINLDHLNADISQNSEPFESKRIIKGDVSNTNPVISVSEPTSALIMVNHRNTVPSSLSRKSERALDLEESLDGNEHSETLNIPVDVSEIKSINKVNMCLSPSAKASSPDGRSFIHSIKSVQLESNNTKENSNGPTYNGTLTRDDPESKAEINMCSKSASGIEVHPAKCNSHPVTVKKDGHYFLGVVSEAESELSWHCAQMEQLLMESVPEEIGGRIRAANGKASLLITKKFKQFRDLCHSNLTPSADEQFQTTAEDLIGFWDLVQLQIDDIQRLFNEIYKLQTTNWIDSEAQIITPTTLCRVTGVTSKDQTVTPVPKKSRPSRPSEASKAREEARKRLMAAKTAGRLRKTSETEEDIQIFIS